MFISYSHDSAAHCERVLRLSERLRIDGIHACLDQYVPGSPVGGWTRWMLNRLDWAEYVLLVCTEPYWNYFLGRQEGSKGLGADYEGRLITLEIYYSRSRTRRFVPATFSEADLQFIPIPVRDYTHYDLSAKENYPALLDFLRGAAGVEPAPLGPYHPQARRQVDPLDWRGASTASQPEAKLHDVPSPIAHYQPRTSAAEAIKQALLLSPIEPGRPHVGIHGMGGVGKTVLAAAVAHDSDVRRTFSDGIYWISVGPAPNVLHLQTRLAKQLRMNARGFTSQEEAKDALHDALFDRRALLVLDDLWQVGDADAFMVTEPPTRVLMTSRDSQVVLGLGANPFILDMLSLPEALRLLAQSADIADPGSLPPEATAVAHACECLPLALAMIGAMGHNRPNIWSDALASLAAADLEEVKRTFHGYPYPNLLAAVEVSINALRPTDRERYLDLAVFGGADPIPDTTLAAFWQMTVPQAHACMADFIDRSLSQRVDLPGRPEALIPHRLQRDLIHKRREPDLPKLHQRLLQAWGDPKQLPDAFAYRWIAYHLVQAGRSAELRELLLDPEFLRAKFSHTDVNSMLSDYDLFPGDPALAQIRLAFELSAHVLARDAQQLPAQLLGRLAPEHSPAVAALCRQALRWSSSPALLPLDPTLHLAGGAEWRRLDHDTGNVPALAVTDDRRWSVLLAEKETGALQLWSSAGKNSPQRLQDHASQVDSVALSETGKWGLSWSRDGMLGLWDLSRGECVNRITHPHVASALAISGDGRRGVSASPDSTLSVWSLPTGELERSIRCHRKNLTALALSRDGRWLVSAGRSPQLKVWDLASFRCVRTLDVHAHEVRAVAISADHRWVVAALPGHCLRVWDISSQRWPRYLLGQPGQYNAFAFSSAAELALSGSSDHRIRAWNVDKGQALPIELDHGEEVDALALSPNGRWAISGSHHGQLHFWDLQCTHPVRPSNAHAGPVNALVCTRDGRSVLSASEDGALRLWDLSTRQSRILFSKPEPIRAATVLPNGKHVLCASPAAILTLWDLATGKLLDTFSEELDDINALAAVPAGDCFLCALGNGCLAVWDLAGEGSRAIRRIHRASVNALAVTPDGCSGVSASHDKTLRIWSLSGPQDVAVLEGHADWVTTVALVPGGCQAISGSVDRTLRLWDLSHHQCIHTFRGHEREVRSVAVSPDGAWALSASSDRSVRVWDMHDHHHLATFDGDHPFTCCVIAPDAQTVVAGDQSGAVHFLKPVGVPRTAASTPVPSQTTVAPSPISIRDHPHQNPGTKSKATPHEGTD